MILVSTLYDEYIDRPKVSEQKNPFEYIVPPPSRGVGTIKLKICETNDELLRQEFLKGDQRSRKTIDHKLDEQYCLKNGRV